ncbi:MAG: anti-sigma factor family protein [Pseudorhodobacter sp.]
MIRTIEPGEDGPEGVTDDMLMALADGELNGATALRLRSRIAADPGLAERFAVFEATSADLRAAFDAGPVPDRLVQTIAGTPMGASPANVTALPLRRPFRALAPMAVAASVVLALATGFLAGRATEPAGPVASAMIPAEAAAMALASLPTGAETTLSDGGTARALGSYRTDQGLCRMIALEQSGQQQRAIVCGSGADWTVAMTLQTGIGRGFVTASDTVAELVDGYLDRIGASAALTPEEEAAALAP